MVSVSTTLEIKKESIETASIEDNAIKLLKETFFFFKKEKMDGLN